MLWHHLWDQNEEMLNPLYILFILTSDIEQNYDLTITGQHHVRILWDPWWAREMVKRITENMRLQMLRQRAEASGRTFKSTCHHYLDFTSLMVIFTPRGMHVMSEWADIYLCVDWRLEGTVRECRSTCLDLVQGDKNTCFVCSHYNLPTYQRFKLQSSFDLAMCTRFFCWILLFFLTITTMNLGLKSSQLCWKSVLNNSNCRLAVRQDKSLQVRGPCESFFFVITLYGGRHRWVQVTLHWISQRKPMSSTFQADFMLSLQHIKFMQHVKSFLMQMMLTLAGPRSPAIKLLYAPHNDKHEICL